MRYEVIVMPSAEQDIIDIIGYISDNLQNKKAAAEHYDAFKEALKSLEYMPDRNPISGLDVLNERQLRLIPVGNYVVIYRVFDEESLVEVYRVLYGKMDLEKRVE